MKKVLILTLLMGLVSMSGFTQEGLSEKPKKKTEKLTPEEKAKKRTDKMTEMLGLNDEQAGKIEAINLEHAIEMDKIKQEHKALKEKAKKQRELTHSNIKNVLTPEQQATFEKKREERRKKHEEHKKHCQHK
jgi:Spy/CpxP family protein refolding chaperone